MVAVLLLQLLHASTGGLRILQRHSAPSPTAATTHPKPTPHRSITSPNAVSARMPAGVTGSCLSLLQAGARNARAAAAVASGPASAAAAGWPSDSAAAAAAVPAARLDSNDQPEAWWLTDRMQVLL